MSGADDVVAYMFTSYYFVSLQQLHSYSMFFDHSPSSNPNLNPNSYVKQYHNCLNKFDLCFEFSSIHTPLLTINVYEVSYVIFFPKLVLF